MVKCLDCGAEIKVRREAELDEIVVCKRCGTRFVVVDLDPVEVDFADDDEGEDWEDDDWEDDWDGDED